MYRDEKQCNGNKVLHIKIFKNVWYNNAKYTSYEKITYLIV